MRALAMLGLAACSYAPRPATGDDGLAPDGAVTSSVIEWLGDLELRRDGYAVPLDKVLPGAAQVCAQSFPIAAAERATLRAGDREIEMTIEADGVGPFGHNRRWCAPLPADAVVADRELALRVVAVDAAGAIAAVDGRVTPRTEIALFDVATDAAAWRMAGRGSFAVAGDTLVAQPGNDLGLYWSTIPTPADFELALEARLDRFDDNSGIFIRFRDPDTFGYDNTAWVGVDDGLEIQIDEIARPDGADIHRTGAVYEQPSLFVRPPDGVPGVWRRFEITVRGARIVVRIDGAQVTDLTYAGDPARPERAKPSAPGAPRFVGLQTHTGAVAFRNVRLRVP